jgi:hypothetical protein
MVTPVLVGGQVLPHRHREPFRGSDTDGIQGLLCEPHGSFVRPPLVPSGHGELKRQLPERLTGHRWLIEPPAGLTGSLEGRQDLLMVPVLPGFCVFEVVATVRGHLEGSCGGWSSMAMAVTWS